MNTEANKNWLPTPENIAALPEEIRNYVRHLESHCDPEGIVRQNTILAEQNEQLEALLKTYVKEEAEKYKEVITAILTEYIKRQLVLAFADDFAAARGGKVIYFGNPIGGKSIVQALMLAKYASAEAAPYHPVTIGIDECAAVPKDFWDRATAKDDSFGVLLDEVNPKIVVKWLEESDSVNRIDRTKKSYQERSGAFGAVDIGSKRRRKRF